ncbi:unnamed protein product [Psylliodes chrysocephalus]|uniref:SWIM-type domain-containing protein n=1 Tax=Psylliodes chrysocephalus TaxID=3402493 RepID=A0A9P0CUK8_9CUCU|nr:unnamed protein product [Psylliodes chrysocephala]
MDKLSDYAKGLAKTSLEGAISYSDKIKGLNLDPYTLTDADLDFEVEAIPPISNMDIVIYLVLTNSYYTEKQMKAYKSLTPYKYFEAGFVEKVGVKQVNGYMLLVGKVQPPVQHSMHGREPELHVWIITERDGGICTAHCTCMTKLGEVCNHIAAVLYAVEHVTNLKNSTSCITDIKSTWPVPFQSGLQPVPIRLMDWGPKKSPSIKVDVKPMTNDEMCSLLRKIQDCGYESALMRIVEPFASEIANSSKKTNNLQ